MTTIEHFERALGPARCSGRRASDRRQATCDATSSSSSGCGSTRTPCARRTPTTARTRRRCCSATSRPRPTTTRRALPGGMVFTCLSHDIIAHETTHAMLDGLHRRFIEPTNPDVLAFHEAFADIVALFQHFTFPEVLRAPDRAARAATWPAQNLLGAAGAAVRPGDRHATARCATPSATIDDDEAVGAARARPERATTRRSSRTRAAPSWWPRCSTPSSRSTRAASRDLLRIATGGTGVLPDGRAPPRPREPPGRRGGEGGRATCSTCASARSTTARRSTSPSASTCAR